MQRLPPKRDEDEVIKDALVWVGYYAYSLALATLIVLTLSYIVHLVAQALPGFTP